MSIELCDTELLKKAARGSAAAFGALYDRRSAAVFRFALQMSGSRDIAEEVTQDTFLTLARDLSGYDEQRGTMSAYLLGIARNLVRRRFERDRAGQLVTGEDNEEPAVQIGPLDCILKSEATEAVRRAVLALPECYREAVVLCDLQELSYAEAAQIMRCPVGTVRSKLSRGRALLAERLESRKGCFV